MSLSETQPRSPYQGLIPYSEADAPFFFGREKETRLIVANLFGSPLTLLYGASGVGKSSVLRAGVAYQLRAREDILVVVFNAWQSNAASDLKQAVADWADLADHAAWRKAVSLLPQDRPASLVEFLTICATQLNRRLMIILDQFEEYFLYHPQDDEFAVEFPRVITQSDAPVSFLISIREDSLAKLDRFEGRIPSLFDNYLRIEHLNRDAARDAILKPIDRYNELQPTRALRVSIEKGLVNTVLAQVQTGQVVLGEGVGAVNTETGEAQIETPFLQLVMTRLWREEMLAGSTTLRLATLEQLGGAESIVKNHLNEAMDQLLPTEQNVAAKVFPHLVTRSRTKIAYPVFDLIDEEEIDRTQLESVLKKLSAEEELAGEKKWILRPIPALPGERGGMRYEIFHDVLAAAILDWRSRYMQAQELTVQQLKLVAERQRVSRLRLALLGLAVLLLLMMGITGYAYVQRRNALAAQTQAEIEKAKTKDALTSAEAEKTKTKEALTWAEAEKSKAENALTIAESERTRANAQAALAAERQAEAEREKIRAEGQTILANKRLDILKQAANETDPETMKALVQQGAGIKQLTTDQQRLKQEAERLASAEGRKLVRTPTQYGLKLWANGATLRVKFLQQNPQLEEVVKQAASEWLENTNLHFEFVTNGRAEIRVSFKEDYSYSYLGTDALGIPQDEATLELGIMRNQSRQTQLQYARHELGHVFGLIEEVNSPNAHIPWDLKALKNLYGEAGAFSFTRVEKVDYRPFDPKSIMMYNITNAMTGGRFEALMSTELSEGDKAFARKLYPLTS